MKIKSVSYEQVDHFSSENVPIILIGNVRSGSAGNFL